MSEAIKNMHNWIKLYYPDMIYTCIIIIAMVYLLVAKKEQRRSIVYPIIVILICILNPFLYQKLLRKMVYWRMFWMIPDAILVSLALTDIIKRCRLKWVKTILFTAAILLVVITGVRVYNRDVFDFTKNPQKVSDNTQKVCDAILSIDEHPRCIIPDGMYTEARQYNGDIELMYGRNADGYINELSEKYKEVHYNMCSDAPNYEYVFEVAHRDGYDFVVCNKNKPVPDEVLQRYGYVGCLDAGEYWVYYDE